MKEEITFSIKVTRKSLKLYLNWFQVSLERRNFLFQFSLSSCFIQHFSSYIFCSYQLHTSVAQWRWKRIVKIFDLIIKCTKRNILKFIPLSEIVNCFHVYLCKENNEIMEKVNTTNKLLLKLNRGRIRKREIMMTTRIRITSFKNVMVMDIAICSLKLYIYTNI